MKGGTNFIKEKSFRFAIRIVHLHKLLQNRSETVLSKQLLRSGTSVGALIRESEQAESRADFIHKLSIALKEADETEYWLALLHETEYLNEKEYGSIVNDCRELLRILTAIIKTRKKNKNE